MVNGTDVTFDLAGGTMGEATFLVLGTPTVNVPFAGGLIVPNPFPIWLVAPLSPDAGGNASLTLTVPFAPGTKFYVQVVALDFAGSGRLDVS